MHAGLRVTEGPRRRWLTLAVAALAVASALPAAGPAPVTAAAGEVRLMAVGDLMLAQSIGRRIVRNGAHVPFQHVAHLWADADILVANLECAISNRGTRADKRFTFRAPLGRPTP